jgi:hypothetical protein
MSTIIIEKKVTPLVCHRCSWKWNYTGKNPYVATCPFCRTNISIRKYKRLLEQSKKENKLQQIHQKEVSHNHYGGKAVVNALEFKEMIGMPVSETSNI